MSPVAVGGPRGEALLERFSRATRIFFCEFMNTFILLHNYLQGNMNRSRKRSLAWILPYRRLAGGELAVPGSRLPVKTLTHPGSDKRPWMPNEMPNTSSFQLNLEFLIKTETEFSCSGNLCCCLTSTIVGSLPVMNSCEVCCFLCHVRNALVQTARIMLINLVNCM